MDCLDNESVCSVKKENNSGYYRLHTIWKKDGFFINVTSKNGSWRGEMTSSDVEKMSSQLELEPETYLDQCKSALTCHGGMPGIVYAVEEGTFSWKKVVDEDSGIKIKMGSVMLEPTLFVDTIQNLVTAALKCNQNLEERLKELTEEKRKILENRNEVLDKLNELIKTKERMESDLYARFILLTNAKKKKIQELENLLEEEYKKGQNLGNPYEIDTDADSPEETAPTKTQSGKGRRKIRKTPTKKTRKNCALHQDVPEEKKAKNTDEVTGGNLESGCTNLMRLSSSPEPSTSTNETVNQGEMTEKVGLTKEDLYNYFYGEL